MPTAHGKMKVEMRNAKSITGRGAWESDTAGQVWFDFRERPYPSSIDWKQATNLTFIPDIGKEKPYSASETQYLFNGGWVGPRLILHQADRRSDL